MTWNGKKRTKMALNFFWKVNLVEGVFGLPYKSQVLQAW